MTKPIYATCPSCGIVLKPGDGGNDTPMGLSVGADEILGVIAALHQARDIMAAGVESENIL